MSLKIPRSVLEGIFEIAKTHTEGMQEDWHDKFMELEGINDWPGYAGGIDTLSEYLDALEDANAEYGIALKEHGFRTDLSYAATKEMFSCASDVLHTALGLYVMSVIHMSIGDPELFKPRLRLVK